MDKLNNIDIMNAVKAEPQTTEEHCPWCGGDAKYDTWDQIDGGCLNSYWRIKCDECGHTESNNIF